MVLIMSRMTPLTKILKIMKESSQFVHISTMTGRLERASRAGGAGTSSRMGTGREAGSRWVGRRGWLFEDDCLGFVGQFIPSFLSGGLELVPLF